MQIVFVFASLCNVFRRMRSSLSTIKSFVLVLGDMKNISSLSLLSANLVHTRVDCLIIPKLE